MSERPDLDHKVHVRVQALRYEALDILSIDLKPLETELLPEFTAGAHVDVFLPTGIRRSYSLASSQERRDLYTVAVSRDPASKGGSRYVHEQLRPGQELWISAPRNNFPLDQMASKHVMFAGGIGVTPFCSMIERLNALERDWHVYFCARSRNRAAFLSALEERAAKGRGEVTCLFDDELGVLPDLAAIVRAQPPAAHLYCCGPLGMLNAFKRACADKPPSHVHLEYFSSDAAPDTAGGFTVILARSGRRIWIPPGSTILSALLENGLSLQFSCEEGVCGACETGVISGLPEHRDMVLTDAEHEANRSMMICCSGAKTPELVLDL